MLSVSSLIAPESTLEPQQPAGLKPSALDKVLSTTVSAAEAAISSVSGLEKQVKTALENMGLAQTGANLLQEADRVSAIYERLSKATLSLVRCTDELARLRSFLAGGPDSRPDLSSKGEIDLQAELLKAIHELGWEVTIPTRGKLEVVD